MDELGEGDDAGARLGATQSSGGVSLSGSGGLTTAIVHPGTLGTPGPALHMSTGAKRTSITGRNPH
jgi:hypothetical protein